MTITFFRQVKRLPEPYAGGDCLQTNEDFVNPLEYFAYYTYDGCRQECIYRFVENACGCVPFMVTGKYMFDYSFGQLFLFQNIIIIKWRYLSQKL